mmetsp:Transcript_27732/g.33890  ORF Transcript_27732/g.33890 Transcript_27732/m.33890 type:complete len:123 (-) Transcript_27732:364-732(-)
MWQSLNNKCFSCVTRICQQFPLKTTIPLRLKKRGTSRTKYTCYPPRSYPIREDVRVSNLNDSSRFQVVCQALWVPNCLFVYTHPCVKPYATVTAQNHKEYRHPTPCNKYDFLCHEPPTQSGI